MSYTAAHHQGETEMFGFLFLPPVQSTEAVGDWRKNIEDKADRKKMFETS